MDVRQIGSFLRASLDGMDAGTFRQDNEEVKIIVGFSADARIRSGALSQLKLISPAGEGVPLSSLTRLEWGDAPASIQRLDGKREITVTAEAYDTDSVREINRNIQAAFEEQWGGRNLRLSAGGEFSELDDLLIRIARIFLLGLFLIYMILGSQFRSYSQPFLILMTLPFTFAGVVLFLFLSGTAFSTTVLYAAVALAGIAVNDSIVLISFINEQIKGGAAVEDAVKEAVAVRVRPVLLTSLTTIAGLLPTALGLGGKSVIWGPMAGTVIFGLIFSTLTALFLIPCFYGIFYDRRKG
jgi:multidrug efflux pump subunit AcrB